MEPTLTSLKLGIFSKVPSLQTMHFCSRHIQPSHIVKQMSNTHIGGRVNLTKPGGRVGSGTLCEKKHGNGSNNGEEFHDVMLVFDRLSSED